MVNPLKVLGSLAAGGAASTGTAWGTAGQESLPKSLMSHWDVFTAGGVPMPGIARVSGPGVVHQIQTKKTPGQDGAWFTDLGRDIAKFTVTLTLGTTFDWDGFSGFVQYLQPLNPTGKLMPVSVSHPAINVLGIFDAYCTRVGIPHPGSVVGTFEVDLEWVEWRKPVATGTGTPKKKSVNDFSPAGKKYMAASAQAEALEAIARNAPRSTPAEAVEAAQDNEAATKARMRAEALRDGPPPSITNSGPDNPETPEQRFERMGRR